MPRQQGARAVLLPLLAGAAAFGVAFPPFPPLIGALVAVLGFGLALERQAARGGGLAAAIGLGAIFAVVAYAPNGLWITTGFSGSGGSTAKGMLAYAAMLAATTLPLGAAAAAFHLARRGSRLPAALLLPLCWVSGEVAIAHLGDIAFPWLPLGLSVAGLPLLLQSADLSGVHGVSVWIAALAGAILDCWRVRTEPRRMIRPLLVAAVLMACVTSYGVWRLGSVAITPAFRVAVVQPNVGRAEKHDPALLDANVGRLTELTREAAPLDVQLVLWPETALAGTLDDRPGWRDSLRAAALATGAPLLTGVVQRLPPGADGRIILFNAAVLTDSAGALGSHPGYRKRVLVPVTERIPFVDPAWFSDAYPPPLRGFSAGTMEEPLLVGEERVGALICFESAFPGLVRGYRAAGATLIANLTNDAVLGEGRGPAQHLAHIAVRAVEGRVSVIQAANSGISALADPTGVVHDPTPRDTALVRGYDVYTTGTISPYVILGDWLGFASVAGTALLVAASLRLRGRCGG